VTASPGDAREGQAPPLQGIRVVEVAQYVAAPLAGTLLAELGADVIKIEPPGGDAYRQTMPLAPGIGRFFLPLNRGKRSVELDLKTERGRTALRAVLDTADVVTHNAPPERATAFGLDWEELHAAVPRLVMGVVSSFGAEGELAGAPAYDLVAQARSGLLTSHAAPGDTVPVRAGGIPLADLTAGFLLSTAVLAALVRAGKTGVGERVEVSLLAAALAAQLQDLVWLADERVGRDPVAQRSDLTERADEIALGLALNPYYRCYEASDGFIAVACLNLVQREAFAREFAIDDPTIAAPDVIPDDEAVRERKRSLTAAVATRIATAGAADWVARLTELGVPAGPVHARERVTLDRQIIANGFLATVDQPGLGPTTMLGSVFGVGVRAPLRPAPEAGADTAAVLAEVGVS
jgi:crotonobetainyl-CoA:carnitine CoA-transferase CaiB-like acyl-CoA transferase